MPTYDKPDATPNDRLSDVSGTKTMVIGSNTVVGGYAEIHYNYSRPSGGPSESTVDIHRLVLMVGHSFNDWIRFYTELEVEHAYASSDTDDPGEVEVEQAYLDFDVVKDALTIRTGAVLAPFGLINQRHEPPLFNSVERPLVDRVIIPTTWREGAVGIYGQPTSWLRYQVYGMTTFNPMDFSAAKGIRGGRQHVAEARAKGFSVIGRLELEPTLGLVIGASGMYGKTGPNAGALYDELGARLHLDVPLTGFDVDFRWLFHGLEARAEVASFFVGDTAGLRTARNAEGDVIGPDTGKQTLGAYGEVAYDVLHPAKTEQELALFVRGSYANTMQQVSGRARTADDDANRISEWLIGAAYRPIQQVVVKVDVGRQYRGGDGLDATLVDVGVGTMF